MLLELFIKKVLNRKFNNVKRYSRQGLYLKSCLKCNTWGFASIYRLQTTFHATCSIRPSTIYNNWF